MRRFLIETFAPLRLSSPLLPQNFYRVVLKLLLFVLLVALMQAGGGCRTHIKSFFQLFRLDLSLRSILLKSSRSQLYPPLWLVYVHTMFHLIHKAASAFFCSLTATSATTSVESSVFRIAIICNVSSHMTATHHRSLML